MSEVTSDNPSFRKRGGAGMEELALYCTTCQITLTMMKWLYPTTQPVRHLL
ncbi:MAG: hypothetical protein SWK76_00335 [Actinomycetota bacterium]|nr:hypothetical protein [Actinomycetota bacterium]